MGATADTIWQVPAYLPYLQPPVTDKVIDGAEKKIGYRLPPEYLNLLRRQNGGYIHYSLPEMLHDTIAGIGPHFPSLTEFDWDYAQQDVSFPLQGLVPFDGDGHWHLCLDYRANRTRPSVTYVDVECDWQKPVAGTFQGYLAMLQIDVQGKYIIEAVTDIEAVKSGLSRALWIRFQPPDSWASGYPTHCARFPTGSTPEQLWLSPNVVPRGFVRPDDPRYEELKDLVPGTAARYPELPANSYVLDATDGVRSRVIDACVRLKLVVRPLSDYLSKP